MAFDIRRPVPWKRLGFFLGLYATVMLAVTALTNRNQIASSLFSIAFGVVVAGLFLITLAKFGWTMPILRSREEIAQARAQRLAQRQSRRGGPAPETADGPRPKAAPTRRTSTGPSQHPRRTRSTRRR